jgi:hypothetical protein
MALLIGGEAAAPFHRVVQRLLRPAPAESETNGQDEEGEAGKPAAASQAIRRSFRKHSSSPTNHSHARFGLHARLSPISPFLSRPDAPAGELAYRNGVGAPLRC